MKRELIYIRKILLRDGEEVIIREAEKRDVKSIIDFYNIVGGETDFLSFGGNEFQKKLIDYEIFIETVSNEVNSIMLISEIDNKIIGIASINSSPKDRFKHVGEFGIVIARQYWGQGLGKKS